VQIEVEFWSTSFAAPEPSLLNLLIELVGNYPPMPLVIQKNVSKRAIFYSPSPPQRISFSPYRSSLCYLLARPPVRVSATASQGETLWPGAALGNRGTQGVDAVELEATGGSRPRHSAAAASSGSRGSARR